MVKKISSLIILFLLSFNVVNATQVDVVSERYILYNMNDGTILDEKDPHTQVSIASLTKIMTVIVAIENIDDYDKKVTITNDMLKDIDWDVVVTGFKVGQEVTYDDLLYGSILSSGADAINALGFSIAGDMDSFVKLMNNKVSELGLKNTKFSNAVGLYDKNNYSSAYDMAQILIYALKNKKFKEVFETKEYKLSINKTIKSTIYRYSEKGNSNIDLSKITGAKTGYIQKAGNCLASTATINDVNYLLVTLNAMTNGQNDHLKDSVKIYNYFGDNYSYQNVVSKNDIVVTLDTIYANEEKVSIKAGVEIEKYLKNGFDKSNLKYEYNGLNEIDVDTKLGTKIGSVKVLYNNEVLDEFDLLFNETLTISVYGIIRKNIVLILVGVVFLIIFGLMGKKKRRRRRKK